MAFGQIGPLAQQHGQVMGQMRLQNAQLQDEVQRQQINRFQQMLLEQSIQYRAQKKAEAEAKRKRNIAIATTVAGGLLGGLGALAAAPAAGASSAAASTAAIGSQIAAIPGLGGIGGALSTAATGFGSLVAPSALSSLGTFGTGFLTGAGLGQGAGNAF